MAGSVIPSNGPVPLAPTAVYNVVMNAVSSGDIETVRQCIVQEPELINTFGWHRQTVLHRACLVGKVDIVKLLLDLGADPNARNNFDETPLHYACKRGLPPVVRCMLDKGGDVTLLDKLGKGVFHHAAEAGSVHVLHLLQALYPDLTFMCQDNNLQTPLHAAIKAGKLEAFKYLIKKGRSNLKCPDNDGNWPVHLSAKEGYGHMTWTQLCILGLPALHVVNKHGCTPYELANMYDTPPHKELLSELEWLRRQSDTTSVRQHAYILWFFYLLLPALSYGMGIVVTRFMPGYDALVFFPIVACIMMTVKKSFHRLEHVSRWPHPIYAGAFAAGLFHTILVYLIVILPYMNVAPKLRLASFVLIVAIVLMYFKLMTKNPGIMTLTSSAQNEVTGKTLTVVDVSVSDKWHTFCADCELVQSPLTKHCKLCGQCMLGMDHHCLFLLRCIARGNHVLFIWFIILCLICMSLFPYSVFLYVSQVYAALLWREVLMEMITVDSWVLTLFLLNCGSIVWGWSLLLYQYMMISNGYTTYFQPRKYRGDLLTGCEKVMNVVYFLLNRRPHVINPIVFAKDDAEVV